MYLLCTFYSCFATHTNVADSIRMTRGGGRGGQEGQLPHPSHGAGWANIILPPPPRNLEEAPRKRCVENAKNGIAPNIPLVETGQVRKIVGPAHSGALANLFAPHSKIPSAATAGDRGNTTSGRFGRCSLARKWKQSKGRGRPSMIHVLPPLPPPPSSTFNGCGRKA